MLEERYEIGKLPNDILSFLYQYLDTESRLSISSETTSHKLFIDPPSQFIHYLQVDDKLFRQLNRFVKEAFGKELIINPAGGGQVWFHIGKRPITTKENDRISEQYLRALNRVNKLADEGDGIRSFVSVLLGLYCGIHPLMLIDEPELFLYPSQAKKLASILAESSVKCKRQLFICTHSADFIKGMIQSRGNVNLFRMTLERGRNRVVKIDKDEVRRIIKSPLSHNVSIITGLFHKNVIICEADADCRFFEYILRKIEGKRRVGRFNDIAFIHGNGKGKIAELSETFRKLSIRYAIICDFDVFENEGEFYNIIGSIGFDKKVSSVLTESARSAFRHAKPLLSYDDIVRRLRIVAKSVLRTRLIGITEKKELQTIMRGGSKASDIKEQGIRVLSGGMLKKMRSVLRKCGKNGLFINEWGALESYWPEGPINDKNKWLINAINEIDNDVQKFGRAFEFMERILRYLR